MIEYLILGLLQGITEWLPVSSQGQTIIVSQFFGLSLQTALDLSIWLHSGTLLAAIVYFRRELAGLFNKERRKLLRFLIISTIFTAIIGGPVYLLFVNMFAEAAGEIIIAIVGLFLIVSALIQKRAEGKHKTEKDVNDKDSVIAGLLQGFAALPGISRSGITTSILLLRCYDAKAALRLSFMMSIFAVAAAEIGLQIRGGFIVSNEAVIAMVGAFATGFLSIDLLLKFAERVKFWKFLIFLGILSLVPLLFHIV
jgi:undecaprenyl-diphosphatase